MGTQQKENAVVTRASNAACGVHRKGDAPGYERRPKGMTHKVRTPQLLGEPEQEAARQRGLQPNARCSGGDVPENKVASDKGEAGRGVSRRKAMSAAPIGHCAPVRHVGQPSSEKLQIPRATSKAEPLQGRDGRRHQWGCHSQLHAGLPIELAQWSHWPQDRQGQPRRQHPCRAAATCVEYLSQEPMVAKRKSFGAPHGACERDVE